MDSQKQSFVRQCSSVRILPTDPLELVYLVTKDYYQKQKEKIQMILCGEQLLRKLSTVIFWI